MAKKRASRGGEELLGIEWARAKEKKTTRVIGNGVRDSDSPERERSQC